MRNSILELKNIYLKNSSLDLDILEDINLKIFPKDFIVILGSNGCGKSSLLKLILGLKRPYSGRVDQNVKDKSFAYVNQDVFSATFSDLSVYENILIALAKSKGINFYFSFKSERARVTDLLNQLNPELSCRLDDPVKNLSGGQKQALALCMAFLKEPSLLALDEHTSALDPLIAQRLMEWTFHNSQKMQGATIMVTHQIEDALKFGNRLLIMKKGRICLELSQEEKQHLKPSDLLGFY